MHVLLAAGMPSNIALLRHSLCVNPRLAEMVALYDTGAHVPGPHGGAATLAVCTIACHLP
jgi:hypothetical protein